MRIVTWFFVILVSVWGCWPNQTPQTLFPCPPIPRQYVLYNTPTVRNQNDTVYFGHQKFSGFLYQLQANGKDTAMIEGYCQGLKTGVARKWYPNQMVMEERSYWEGKKHGKQLLFWENGKKKIEFMAKADVYEGEVKEWNEQGRLVHLANYLNGQEEGPQKLWYENGKVKANYLIINSRRYGLLGTKNCKNVSDSIFAAQ
jgi:antitoxin component YwqK of YwqJK toxin-antitoxin module